MKKLLQRGFTLIELLIVIGILSVLVVTILVTLNPAEAQKKARDTKRMKDLSTISAILEQYINDGSAPICTAGCDSTATVACNSTGNWLGVDLSRYCSVLPTDPSNAVNRTCIGAATGGSASAPTTATCAPVYKVKMLGSNYEINVRQESKGSGNNTYNDGGNDQAWAEVGPDLTLYDNDLGF